MNIHGLTGLDSIFRSNKPITRLLGHEGAGYLEYQVAAVPGACAGIFNRPGLGEGCIGGVGGTISTIIADVLGCIPARCCIGCRWRLRRQLDNGIIGYGSQEAAICYFLSLGAISLDCPQLAFTER